MDRNHRWLGLPGALLGSWLFGVVAFSAVGGDLCAATTILVNQTPHPIQAEFPQRDQQRYRVALRPGEVLPLAIDGIVSFQYWHSDQKHVGALRPDAIYQLVTTSRGQVELRRFDLGRIEMPPKVGGQGIVEVRRPGSVKVVIAVDDDEKTRRPIWEKKLKDRLESASRLLEFFVGMRLKVVGIRRWNTNANITNFEESLREFAQNVPAGSADLVIGFTSQYTLNLKRSRLGGTLGPLQNHIMIREHGPRIGEAERLEVLLHELGHYFGAAHSPDKSTLMRPVLGDAQANRRSFRVVYDPVNLLVMNLVSEQLRLQGWQRPLVIPSKVQLRLLDLYGWLAEAEPDDSAAGQMANVLCRSVLPRVEGRKQHSRSDSPKNISERLARWYFQKSVNRVADAVNRQAKHRQEQSLHGDRLTEAYVRAAATVADQLSPGYATRAFFMGLAIALDRGDLFQRFEPIAERIRVRESLAERAKRERFVGSPTIWGRTGLLQHFVAAGLLTAFSNPKNAETIVLSEEINEAQELTGFSFCDVTANIAGIRMSQALASGELAFSEVARSFSVRRFVPPVKEFPIAWSTTKLQEDYGGVESEEFKQEIEMIRQSVNRLPPYSSKREATNLGKK